jgi:hypothetical protein
MPFSIETGYGAKLYQKAGDFPTANVSSQAAGTQANTQVLGKKPRKNEVFIKHIKTLDIIFILCMIIYSRV